MSFPLAGTFLALIVTELACSVLLKLQPSSKFEHYGGYTKNFSEYDKLLGYRPAASTQVTSLKKIDGKTIYDVVYSIDSSRRRITPSERKEGSATKFAAFFGCSFTFGEGVNDQETLPYFFEKYAPKYQAYNYGFQGYGPQQMLARLEHLDLGTEISQKEGVGFYLYINGIEDRAIGRMKVFNGWGWKMPYYRRDESGSLVRDGNFKSGRPTQSAIYETYIPQFKHVSFSG